MRGFVFGKFYPFHFGHVALIDAAAAQCSRLVVLVCASYSETIPLEIRCTWIAKHYATQPHISVLGYAYDEADLPNTSVSSREVSAIWARVFSHLLPDVEILFTSESYGDFVAAAMGIRHCLFDRERLDVSISATQIRGNPYRYWDYLPPSVRPYYVRKIVILGTESSGKTVLTQQLATYFQTRFVSEVGRDLVAQSYQCNAELLQQIAQQHAHAIEVALPYARRYLFIDTDIHITDSYSRFLLGQPLRIAPWIYEANNADIYLYLDNDVPYIQDGTRLSEADRNRLHDSHLAVLHECQIPIFRISGNWQARWEQALAIIAAYEETND